MPIAKTKSCTRCGETKALENFHKHAHSPDGFNAACKRCRAEYARRYVMTEAGAAVTKAAKDRYRASAHGREHEYAYHRAYRTTPSGQVAFAKAELKVDPVKKKARKQFNHAVRKGRIIRQPCSVCGAWPGEGHHEDYSKPFEVTWLCRPCHAAHHRSDDANV